MSWEFPDPRRDEDDRHDDPMHVYCCYANVDERYLRPQTREAAERVFGDQVEFIDNTRSEFAYCEFLEQVWAAGETFVVIEHDNVVDERVPVAFETCPEPWCVFVYELACGFVPGVLGCVRFRAELMQALPDAMREAAETDSSGVKARAWYRTDVRLDRILRDAGYLPHIHGRVGHLNERQKLADPEGEYQRMLERCAHHVAPGVS